MLKYMGMKLTHPCELLPIRVAHVSIEILLAMVPRHSPGTACRVVQGTPEGFNNLPCEHPRSANEGWSKPGEALLDMTMYMEKTNSPLDLDAFWDLQKAWELHAAITEVNNELAHDVIKKHNNRC